VVHLRLEREQHRDPVGQHVRAVSVADTVVCQVQIGAAFVVAPQGKCGARAAAIADREDAGRFSARIWPRNVCPLETEALRDP
jgi:hypothetical protein